MHNIILYHCYLQHLFKGRVLGQDLTCFSYQTPDPNDGLRSRWALPTELNGRCNCTRILAKPDQPIPCIHRNSLANYWFTDEPGVLVKRNVRGTELLKYLLDCPYEGRPIVTMLWRINIQHSRSLKEQSVT